MKKAFGLTHKFNSFIKLISVSLAVLMITCSFMYVSAKGPELSASITGYAVTKVGATEPVAFDAGTDKLHRGEIFEIVVNVGCSFEKGTYGGKLTIGFDSSVFMLASDKYVVGTPEDAAYSYAVKIAQPSPEGWIAERETSTESSITICLTDPDSSLLANGENVKVIVALKVIDTAAFASTSISLTDSSFVMGGTEVSLKKCVAVADFEVIIEKARPGKPLPPTFKSKTDTMITLTPIDGFEYKCGEGDWTKNNVFTGLTKNTSYTFYQRAYVSDTSFGSEASDGFTTKTLEFATVKALIDSGAPYTYDDTNGYIKGFTNINNTVGELLANIADSSSIKIINSSGLEITSNASAKLGTGTKIQMVDSEGVPVNELIVIIRGDLDGNGNITIVDCMKLRAAQLGKISDVTGAFLQAGIDVIPGRDSLGIVQYMRLRAYQLGKIATLDS